MVETAPSAMAPEIGESPAVAARVIRSRPSIAAIAQRLNVEAAPLAVLCGRGSSGHAGVFLRYLIETRLHLAVSASAPSVVTAFRKPVTLRNALFIVISQSGASPHLVAATRSARDSGARTVAIVNLVPSPVADAAEFIIPVEAGTDQSVAATKTMIASMAAGAGLIAELANDKALRSALDRLPGRLDRAPALDWSKLSADLKKASAIFVASRGLGLGVAYESALKLAEVLRLPSLAYSAAELQHGPRAALSSRTPVIMMRLADETAAVIDAVTAELRESGIAVHLCGGPDSSLPWPGDDHPATDVITMLVPFYRLIERLAREWGFDPDRPPQLRKVTWTF
ncbi:glucosamine--fructose-6-phosphate aminotransferase (isomerizing) [Bradyrhizobium shewense]|uniref:Glucosamine--fructose-6-phosphate aminotransferase (Isomerizing) n=1 Tax=Bradyrhizobium shewense TaxID=1761772 RepID=A0A1C3WS18_9BRAD|nr:SIS domain-containing protein [Bradyrhizobium shewense]SCB42863.1 glucosamine--fructose-6-phosphate aminotransferase (isomerizing) [Bradyrhizobium shewense]